MKQAPLGNTGARVSAMSLGCMYFGTTVDEDTSFRLLDLYAEAGGSFLDTANCYAFWIEGCVGDESEALLGRWMTARKNRDRVFLASKVGSRPAFVGGEWPRDAQGLSADVIHKSVNDSLRRLQTDYLDLCYAHIDDRGTPLEETLGAFAQLVEAGKIRRIGCSNMLAWRIERAKQLSRSNGWPEYCCVQQKYTYLRPVPGADFGGQVYAGRELLDYCETRNDLTLLAYSPLLSGAYTRADRAVPSQFAGPDAAARVAVLRAVANDVNATPNQVVLAWMMQGTPKTIPVIAASTSAQLEENLGAVNLTLSIEQLERLTVTPWKNA